jgi:hypothetical protein
MGSTNSMVDLKLDCMEMCRRCMYIITHLILGDPGWIGIFLGPPLTKRQKILKINNK